MIIRFVVLCPTLGEPKGKGNICFCSPLYSQLQAQHLAFSECLMNICSAEEKQHVAAEQNGMKMDSGHH